MYPPPSPQVYVQLERAPGSISCTYTGRNGHWTWSSTYLDLAHTHPGPGPPPPRCHFATSNAENPQKCVTHCIRCNEQRANQPKPRYSLHASPSTAQVSHLSGAGFTLKRRKGSSHYTFWPIIVDCDDPRIAALRIWGPKRVTGQSPKRIKLCKEPPGADYRQR